MMFRQLLEIMSSLQKLQINCKILTLGTLEVRRKVFITIDYNTRAAVYRGNFSSISREQIKMKNFFCWFLFLIFFLPQVSFAKPDLRGQKIEFELAKIDASDFVSSEEFLGKKLLVLFFDSDCLPCIQKIKDIKKSEFNFDKINIVIINLLEIKSSKKMLLNFDLDPRIYLLQGPSNPKKFLRKFGNLSGSLPFLTLINDDGKICLTQKEMINNDDFLQCK